MTFLTQTDVVERLYNLLPRGWYPDLQDAPNLQAVLSMLAATYSNDFDGLYQLLLYVQQQARVFTATDFWLDLAAQDYFGSRLQRHVSESDTSYRRRIILNLLAPRGTRPALVANVTNLTGVTPRVIELRNPGDCGSYSSLGNPVWGGAAYNQQGAYGTLTMPFQLLISVQRPQGEGIPLINGYSMPGSGYATYPKPFGFTGGNLPPANTWGISSYEQLIDIIGQVTDTDIYQMVSDTMPAGTIAWTAIHSEFVESPPIGGGAMLDVNFYLNMSVLSASRGVQGAQALANMAFPILFHATMVEQAHLLGHFTMSPFRFSAGMSLVSPLMVTINMIMPIIVFKAAMQFEALSAKFTIPAISMTPTVIFTGQTQPLLPANLPFTLGTIVGAQPLIGINFILGQSAPGEAGGMPAIAVNSVCHVGDFAASVPPSLASVTAGTVAGLTEVTGVGLSSSFNIPAVSGTTIAAPLAPQPQPVLPETLPFLLGGGVQTQPQVTLALPDVQSTTILGSLAVPPRLAAVTSQATLGTLGVSTSAFQTFNPTRKTSNISLSPDLLTATKTIGTSADPIFGTKTATSGLYYWEVTVSITNASQITAGIANITAPFASGDFIGFDVNSIGWAANGNVLENNISQASWPTWTSTGAPIQPQTLTTSAPGGTQMSLAWGAAVDVITMCFAFDAYDGLLYGRIGAGPWNGGGATTSAGLVTLGVTPLGQGTSSGSTAMTILGQTPLGSSIAGQSSGAVIPPPSGPPNAPQTQVGTILSGSVVITWQSTQTGLLIPSTVFDGGAIGPAVTLFSSGDKAVMAVDSAHWQYQPPDGYTAW
jgi:hypothetical protein